MESQYSRTKIIRDQTNVSVPFLKNLGTQSTQGKFFCNPFNLGHRCWSAAQLLVATVQMLVTDLNGLAKGIIHEQGRKGRAGHNVELGVRVVEAENVGAR